jgi:D-inositol-3-phosphate glycosyltransferase
VETKKRTSSSEFDFLPTFTEGPSDSVSCIEAMPEVETALLTGGIDRPYASELAMSLAKLNVMIDVIGNDVVDCSVMHNTPNLHFVNLWPGGSGKAGALTKCFRLVRHYIALLRYAAACQSAVFHILWNSKIQLFDRTILMLYYKALGKKITLTAHNVNQARRDGKDSALNRLTLRIQYRLTDHIFVHTPRMKNELITEFGVEERRITVIRHPLNDAFPNTDLSVADAKSRLGLSREEKAILCFGRIKPYKGVEHLLAAFKQLAARDSTYRLIVAGEVQKGNETYLMTLKQSVVSELENGQILLRTEFIPDEEMEVYLKAADVLVLPYIEIFQSGVLFLGYSFGLPVIATDVGAFREEIVEGVTGYVCKAADPEDLAATLRIYFESDLYRSLDKQREKIRERAEIHHSWGAVAGLTRSIYAELLGRSVA